MSIDNEKSFEFLKEIFDSKKLMEKIFENLKKELIEVIFMEELSMFKKAIFIQGIISYANLILASNKSLSEEEKNKKMTEIINVSKILNDNLDDTESKYTKKWVN